MLFSSSLFGMHKEMWIETSQQMQDALEIWDKNRLRPWLNSMEKNIFRGDYPQCHYLLVQLRPNSIDSLPNGLSDAIVMIIQQINDGQSQYIIVQQYVKILRIIQKSMLPNYSSNYLQKSIRTMEIYLSSPLNENAINYTQCSCQLI